MSVYQDKTTGKYYFSCCYKDWQGERRRKVKRGFKLARDAKAAERDFLAQYAQQCNMSFEAMLNIYIEDCYARLKKSTVISKESLFKSAMLPFFGKYDDISKITPAAVRQWQNKILNEYTKTSARQIHSQLSALFNFAVKFYGLTKNPARTAGSIGDRRADTAQYWTIEEFNAAMQQVESLQDRTAFTTLFYSGLRVGELLALECRDYDSTAHTLTVTKTLSRIEKGWTIAAPKTKKSKRVVTIPQKAASILDEYKAALFEPHDKDTLFMGLDRNHLSYALKKAATAAGVKIIRVHDLRHSHASLLINHNVSIKAISERLGHEDIKTTLNTYAHLYEQQDSSIAVLLDKL